MNFIQSSASGKGLTAARDGRLLASANVSFGAQRGQLSCGSDCGGIQSCSEVVVLFHTVLWEESTINRTLEPEGLWKWLLEQRTIWGEKIIGSQNL